MLTKKMMTRIAQIAPLAAALTISMSPAFARSSGPGIQRQRRDSGTRIVRVTPANGSQGGSTISTASAASTSNGRHFDTDGGASGTSVSGGATPGGGIIRDETISRPRPILPRDETSPVIELDGWIPDGVLTVEEASLTNDPRRLPGTPKPGIHKRSYDFPVDILITDPVAPGDNGLGGFDGPAFGAVDAASTTSARAARRAVRTPQVLLPLIPRSGQAAAASRTTSLSRPHFAVDLNGENGLAASASFTFGRR